jgi:signal peptidase I
MASNRRPLRNSFENILIAIFLALIVRTYFVTGYKVPTSSMVPTLLPGDLIFAFRPAGGFKVPLIARKIAVRIPERGDLVVFTFPDQPRTNYVKRVIGLPGDQIQMQQGRLMVNGQALQYTKLNHELLADFPAADQFEVWEESAPEGARTIVRKKVGSQEDFGPLTVPENEVFVLGDHRDASDDSRYWGTVPIERIEGRVFLIWLSLDWEKKWADNRLPKLRADRLFKTVH